MTFNARLPFLEDDLKIQKFEYLSMHWSDIPQISNISSCDQTKVKKGFNEDDLQWKMTSKHEKLSISALIGSSPNLKYKLMEPCQSRKRFQWRRPTMEDDLKLGKFEYLSSQWLDFPQILNISSWEQTKVKKDFNEDYLQCKMTSKGSWPQNIKI